MVEPPQFIRGTAIEIGEAVFMKVCLPLLYSASQSMPPEDEARLYIGVITAAYATMVKIYGHENASALMGLTTEVLKGVQIQVAPVH